MRLLRLFTTRPYAVAAALLGAMSCQGPATPNALSASLEAIGTLILNGCSGTGATQSCATFSGAMTNNGPGCAGSISGTTVSSDSAGNQVGSANWTFAGTLAAGATGTYTGGPLTVPNNATSSYHTTFAFTSIPCS